MGVAAWIPGLGHWRLGRKRAGLLLFLLFAALVSVGTWRSGRMAHGMSATAKKLMVEPARYTTRDLDFFVSGLLLIAGAGAIVLYSGLSYRRAIRRAPAPAGGPQGHWTIAFRQFTRNRLAVAGAALILALYLVALLAPFLAPFDPTEQGHRVKERLLAPSIDHPLGTDRFARDVLSRIIYGSRISLLVGFLAVGITVTIGTAYGAISGFFGRRVDAVAMRTVDILLSFPTLILIITIIAVWRTQSIWLIIAVIGLTSWMGVARLVRGEFLVLKELEFVQAARALGAGSFRLIFRHILPNAMTPVIVSATLQVGSTILLEAGLSYLGLGVQPPTPSWGNIVYDTKGNIFTEWWMPLSAGLAVVVTVVGYNLLGDGLRDALDPRLRK